MKSFNWLHLSDLHFGLRGQESLWPNIRELFWEDLKKIHEKSGPWDAVLFTGDLVERGAAAEFDELENKVLGPLWRHLETLGSKDPVLLAVPGNHDLVRPDIEKPKAALRMLLNTDRFEEIADDFWSEPDCEYREIISNSLANYKAWSERNKRTNSAVINLGILPGDFVATIELQKVEGELLKIGIAGINTTFLQIARGNYIGRLVIDPMQLHQACGGDLPAWTRSHDACILLTHQGPEWYNKKTGRDAYVEINPAGRFAVHLYGHQHENRMVSTSLGGGKIIRQWQGSSLFGLEKFGDPPVTDRRHGYSAGRIEFSAQDATIQQWPRRAIKDPSSWRISPDHDSCVLVDGDCTEKERLEARPECHKQPENTESDTLEKKSLCLESTGFQLRHLGEMELQLQNALEAFKGQPRIFLEPKISKKREFNEDPNELDALTKNPSDTLILAPPEFGLTCLGLHLQLQLSRNGDFSLYIDARQNKSRKIDNHIDEKILHYEKSLDELKCIILDGWNADSIDHQKMVKAIISKVPNTTLFILAEDSLIVDNTGYLSKLNRNFTVLHLQALSRNSMRKLVEGYNEAKSIGNDDAVLSGLAMHLESINIHRTPLNCYTLLRVLDSGYNEKLLNKSKLLRAILFVMFNDYSSFSFLSDKPEVEECTFVMGCFCKELVRKGTRHFDSVTLVSTLEGICKEKGVALNVKAMVDAFLENNVLVKLGSHYSFRHRYWIFYFAAEWMRHEEEFRLFVLNDRNYVNYPEIIEFYTGIDGKREDAMETILSDLNTLIDLVDKKVGIERSFDPLSSLQWNPSDKFINQARTKIAERVESSNLPAVIKDKHADAQYQSHAPYDQGIRTFLTDYSVLSLLHSIKAASYALRSSLFVDIEVRERVASAIFRGWEEISKVVFWISPLLAKDGRAIHDGFAVSLDGSFSEDFDQCIKEVITSTPNNIIRLMGCDLASKKIGTILWTCFKNNESMLQKHMIMVFIVAFRPMGWYDYVLDYIKLLHPRSFYLGKILSRLTHEITLGNLEPGEELALKRLAGAILSKREYAPKVSSNKEIPINKLLSIKNSLPIDQLRKGNHQSWRAN